MEEIKINNEGKVEITSKIDAQQYIAEQVGMIEIIDFKIDELIASRSDLITRLQNLIK